MRRSLTNLTFEEWLTFVFDHPEDQPHWHYDTEADWWDAPSAVTVEYLSRTFEGAERGLAPYSDRQVANGLDFLFAGEFFYALEDVSVLGGAPWPARRRGLLSMYELFAQCFAPRCSAHLSHRDEPGANPLNGVCYMWWDIYPAHGVAFHAPSHPESAEEDEVLMSVMLRILHLDSDACRESALHGLNHWHFYYPNTVERAIDGFLARRPRLRPEIKAYALGARTGQMQ